MKKIDKSEFDVIISSEFPQEDTTVITTSELGRQWLETAMRNYDAKNTSYSTYLNDLTMGTTDITSEILDGLAVNPQNNLSKVQRINDIVRVYINKDWIIGKVHEVIDTNVNSDYRLSYKDFSDDTSKMKDLLECKKIITDFNDSINLRRLIKNSVPTTFAEGNYVIYCRTEKEDCYGVSWYPLGVVEVSDYDVNGEPQILINIKELVNRLRKTIKKTRKNKALFFENLEKEIKANYPPEVYKAYKNKDDYAKLDRKWSGDMRINNQNRKYGITPIFRALYPALMLEQFDETDRINAKAKAKKFIVQILRQELMGEDGNKESFEEQAYAHQNLMEAFKQKTVLVTPPAYVEDIKYVEPSTSNTDVNTVSNYVNRELSTLGISFLMNSDGTGASVASISLDQLMKTINSITEQLEFIIEKWYRNILVEKGYSAEFAPTIRILDSELLEMDVKQELAKLLYCNFNSSMETALSILGLDINDEKAKREHENDIGMDKIFSARQTAFTSSGKGEIVNVEDKGGRPKDKNVVTKGKQGYDEQYNKTQRV